MFWKRKKYKWSILLLSIRSINFFFAMSKKTIFLINLWLSFFSYLSPFLLFAFLSWVFQRFGLFDYFNKYFCSKTSLLAYNFAFEKEKIEKPIHHMMSWLLTCHEMLCFYFFDIVKESACIMEIKFKNSFIRRIHLVVCLTQELLSL